MFFRAESAELPAATLLQSNGCLTRTALRGPRLRYRTGTITFDVLINNAGINYDTWETAENADIDVTVAETIRTNLLGPWRVCQAFLPLLRKSRAAA